MSITGFRVKEGTSEIIEKYKYEALNGAPILEHNTKQYTGLSKPGWKPQYIFREFKATNKEEIVFYIEFEEVPSSSTYITLKNDNGDVKYQAQMNGVKEISVTFLPDTDYSNMEMTVNSETYDKWVTVKAVRPYTVNSVEAVRTRLDCLAKEPYGCVSLARFSEFTNGGYYYPTKRYSKNLVTNISPITTEKDMYIFIKPGYQADAYTIKDDGTTSHTGWQFDSIYIPSGKKFTIIIQRANPDTSEIVDIVEMVNAMIILDSDAFTWSDAKYYADFWQSGKAIDYNTGEIKSAGGTWELYTFTNPKFDRIRVNGSIYGRSNAEIAFYSTETPSTESYIKAASAVPGSWTEVHWTEAIVPENCKCCCVSSRNALNDGTKHSIQILINDVEKYANAIQHQINAGLDIMTNKSYRYLYHFNADKLGRSEIPSNSLADIEMAHRLGFKAYEINAHATATPGKYVCTHGSSGKIGNDLVSKTGEDISTLEFTKVTAETFENSYVYRTPNPKYATRITFLDEALTLCRKYGMLPMISFADYYMIDYVRHYCGEDFVVTVYDKYYLRRALFKGAFSLYQTLNADQLRTLINDIGAPFIFSFTTSHLSMTDEQLYELLDICHRNGCIVSFAGVYQTQEQNSRLFKLGCDIMASGWDVEYFDHGNLMSLHDAGTFDDFYHDGTITDGILTLSNGEYFSSQYNGGNLELAKGILTIRFKGTIKLTHGEYVNAMSITSDGSEFKQFSTYFYKWQPNFAVQSVGETEIYNCVYDASEC